MAEEVKGVERVTFSRGYDVCIMAIDGTWRRDCVLIAISDFDAALKVEGSIQGLNLKESSQRSCDEAEPFSRRALFGS